MTSIDDITLLAYVDGELDAAAARTVEESLRGDPRAEGEVRRLRESAALIRAAVNEPVHGSAPPSLLRALDGSSAGAAPSRPRRRWLVAAGIVAMVAVGFGGGYLARTLAPQMETGLAVDDELIDDIVAYHTFYSTLPPSASGERADPAAMEQWLSRQMQQRVRIPDLHRQGYGFETARLLVYEDRPIAQIVYESATGAPVALCIMAAEPGMRPVESMRRGGYTLITWQRSDSLYVVIGAVPEARLRELGAAISAALQQT